MQKQYCYHSPEEVIKIDDVHYYCADKNGVSEFKGDAVINLTGRPNVPHLNIPELDVHVNKTYEELVVSWPDFGVPKVKATFWQALHDYISSKKWIKVCIHCEGGHGRTGTAICSLLISTCGWDAMSTVEYVRDIFCEKLVETPEQCAYLCELDEEVNNRNIEEKDIPVSSMVLLAAEANKTSKIAKREVGLSYDDGEKDDGSRTL
ncbi:MAG: protein-tyrosine phosphatase family protein [Patescibacteria group bacterium]